MNIRHIYIALVLLLMSSPFSTGQSMKERDSLRLLLMNHGEDTLTVRNFITLGQLYESNDTDSAIWCYEKALDISRKLDYTRGIISYYTNVTYVYNILGKKDTSLLLNLQAVEIARDFGDKERLATCLGNVGASFQYMEQYDSAMKYYMESSEIFEGIGLENKLHIIYGNLVAVCNLIGDYDKAFVYFNKGLSLARESNDKNSLLTILNNGSMAFTNAGLHAEAESILNEGIALARTLNNDFALSSMLSNLGDLYLKELRFDESIPVFTEGLEVATSVGDPQTRCTLSRGLAYCYLDKKQYKTAMDYANKSLDLAIKNNILKQEQVNYLVISDIQIAMGNLDNYYKFRYKSDSILTIIDKERIQRNIETLEQQYKARARESHIEELEKEKAVQKLRYRTGLFSLITIVGISFTILIILSMKVRSNRQKRLLLEKEKLIQQQRINELEREKQLAASEAVLKGQEEERMRLAKDLHDGLGGMLSGIKFSFSNVKENTVMSPENQRAFERSMDMLDSSISELRRVAHNMMPESLIRFGLEISIRDICRDITGSGALTVNFQAIGLDNLKADQQTQIIIYRIVQELLNNVMKHAVATYAIVQLTCMEGKLTITVEDDGKGFDTKKLDMSKGIGLSNLKSRVDYLEGKMEIVSEPGKGTTVNIEINT